MTVDSSPTVGEVIATAIRIEAAALLLVLLAAALSSAANEGKPM